MRSAGVTPNVVIYTTLLKGHCAAGDTPAALKLIDAMSKEDPPVVPDLRSLNTFIRGCIRVGDIEAAHSLFIQIKQKWGLEPDATSYKYCVKLLAQGLRFQDLKCLLKELRKAAGKGEEASVAVLSGLENGIALHLDVASAAAMLGKWPAAWSNLERAKEAMSKGNGEAEGGELFNQTRLKELGIEMKRLESFLRANQGGSEESSVVSPDLPSYLSRCFVFSSLLSSEDVNETPVNELAGALSRKTLSTMGGVELVRRDQTTKEEIESQYDRNLTEKGKIKWKKLFKESGGDLPLKMEICSGNGDWVAAQADSESSKANWVALELRHDRVYSIYSRMVYGSLSNLAVLGGDASSIVERNVKKETVSQVCINFPEPPHWSGNESAESKLHLLTPAFFLALWKILKSKGRLTIFSDNYLYCQSLAASLGQLSKGGKSLYKSNDKASITSGDGGHELHNGVRLYYGIPGPDSGHAVNVTSYFDRFWERGQHTERYFIAVIKVDN